jgi:hypothetical protein
VRGARRLLFAIHFVFLIGLMCSCKTTEGKIDVNSLEVEKSRPEYPTYGQSCSSCMYESVYDCRHIPYASVAAIVSDPEVIETTSKCYTLDEHYYYPHCEIKESVIFKKIRLLRGAQIVGNNARFVVAYNQDTYPGKLPHGVVLKNDKEYLVFARIRLSTLLPRAEFTIDSACEDFMEAVDTN